MQQIQPSAFQKKINTVLFHNAPTLHKNEESDQGSDHDIVSGDSSQNSNLTDSEHNNDELHNEDNQHNEENHDNQENERDADDRSNASDDETTNNEKEDLEHSSRHPLCKIETNATEVAQQWGFKNESTANAWLKRQKRFKAKKKKKYTSMQRFAKFKKATQKFKVSESNSKRNKQTKFTRLNKHNAVTIGPSA